MDTIEQQATETTPVEAAPAAGPQKKRSWWRRADRKGLGTTELTILILVIIIAGLLAGLGISRLISARSGAEHSALKTNIDTVSGFVDTYWNSYAADADGRRKITPFRLCDYLNGQLGGDDLNIRTLQYAPDVTPIVGPAAVPGAADNFATHMTTRANLAAEATCPAKMADLNDAYGDIIVIAADANADGAVTDIITGGAAYTAAIGDDATGADDGTRQERMEAVGLLSTKTVWIAQFGASAGANANFETPPGTDKTFNSAASNATELGAEYIVIGGVAPDGASFCLVKVLDAADNGKIGDYYLARAPQETAGTLNVFTMCLNGVNETFGNSNETTQNSWPEPR